MTNDVQTRVIAVANQKGGVGKTTTTINLGAAIAEHGKRVLLVDLDPQANASTGLGINPRAIEHSMYDVLLSDTPLDDAIEPAADVQGLFVAPSSLDLAGAEIELVPGFNRERRLIDAIAPIRDDYDFIFIDCPPSLGLLTINALVAADEVLVPIQCEYYALEGVGQLVRNVELVRKSLNPTLEVSTIVLVMYDARTKLAGQVVDEVRAHLGRRSARSSFRELSDFPKRLRTESRSRSSIRRTVGPRHTAILPTRFSEMNSTSTDIADPSDIDDLADLDESRPDAPATEEE